MTMTTLDEITTALLMTTTTALPRLACLNDSTLSSLFSCALKGVLELRLSASAHPFLHN
jgi:hypothetical protein